MIGSIQLIDLGLKVYVLKDADKMDYYVPAQLEPGKELSKEMAQAEKENQTRIREQETIRQRQRTVSNSVSMVVVGGAVFLTHQRMIKKDRKRI